MFRTGAFLPLKSCTKMKRVLIDVESYTGTPTLRYCIICIKSAIYNEMCRDAQGYTGKGTMSLYFRSLRKNDSQPAAIAAGCFRHTADTSSLVADVWRKQTRGPSGPTAVRYSFARTPREGTEIATASGRRNLAISFLSNGNR